MIERRFAETKLSRGKGKTKIVGTASVTFQEDQPGSEYELWEDVFERIMPHAFDRCLQNNPDVVALFNHDPSKVLGRTPNTLKLKADERGLHYSIDPNDTTYSQDLIKLIERGDIKGSSFGFIPRKVEWKDEGTVEVREIHDCDLVDISPVTYPAYGSTSTGLRGTELDEVKNEYREWRNYVETERREKRMSEIIDSIDPK